ncbi:hypothetical protein GCM10022250_34750 [Flavobacterium chungbukense]|uniref:Uncharacterized protein n=1 Tax=Flavobacterium chungbukense TaxID=877464 RepID=A0ABP7YJL8_9FLAO
MITIQKQLKKNTLQKIITFYNLFFVFLYLQKSRQRLKSFRNPIQIISTAFNQLEKEAENIG